MSSRLRPDCYHNVAIKATTRLEASVVRGCALCGILGVVPLVNGRPKLRVVR